MIYSILAPLLCRLIVINAGDSILNISPAPTGMCALCCSIKYDRDIEFQLYTNKNPMWPQILKIGNRASLKYSNFDSRNPTVLFLHGYAEKSDGRSASTIKRGDSILNISPAPTGMCALCCSIKYDRDIEFQLYTNKNPMWPQILKIGNRASLKYSNFDSRNPTVLFLHGYAEKSDGRSASTIKRAYLMRGNYNVILVDWGRLATLPWYLTAVRNTRYVGRHVGRFVKWLNNVAVPMSTLHVIGFSLGAEAAGFMGKSLAPQKVGRITGLDAAYPLYMNTGMDGHLTASDAVFVDVIHTDGGRFGFPSPIGHADFYPNGGRPLQPGCSEINWLSSRMFRFIRHFVICSHNRAWRFYAETIENPTGFAATKCRTWRPEVRRCTWVVDAYMGFATDPRNRGIFYLRTNKSPPFARNLTDLKGHYF